MRQEQERFLAWVQAQPAGFATTRSNCQATRPLRRTIPREWTQRKIVSGEKRGPGWTAPRTFIAPTKSITNHAYQAWPRRTRLWLSQVKALLLMARRKRPIGSVIQPTRRELRIQNLFGR